MSAKGFKVTLTTMDGEVLEQWVLQREADNPEAGWLAPNFMMTSGAAQLLGVDIADEINRWRFE